MVESSYDAIIIGAGVSGLVAAQELEAYHLKTLVIEADSHVGGRLKTDHYQGFTLDQGFQVILSAYPMVQKHLDLKELNTRSFGSGALCFDAKQHFRVLDVNRKASALFTMLFSPVGGISDKLKMAKLRSEVLTKSEAEIFEEKETSTLDFLKSYGFSDRIIQRFFKPFFGGIFLEPELNTSSRQFKFIFKMFSLGEAVVPEKGMQSVAEQLQAKLKSTEFRYNTKVKEIKGQEIHLDDGDQIKAKQIIIACDPAEILPQYQSDLEWNTTTQYYFKGPKGKLHQDLIALSFEADALISNVACLSRIQVSYGDQDNALYSVSLRHTPNSSDTKIIEGIKSELSALIGSEADHWEFIRSYRIAKALPVLNNLAYERAFEESRIQDGVYLAGDHLLNPSLNAAMLSGEMAAKALILNHKNS